MKKSSLIGINKRGYRADFAWLPDLEKIFIKKLKLNKSVSLALIAGEEIKELNRVYRKKNKVTDVLSFNIDSQEILGEVVICLSVARDQAKEAGKTLKSELQLLVTHGVLHLLGYDHEKGPREKARQDKMQTEILGQLNKK